MRARYPDVEDVVVRDGVRIGYEVYDPPGPVRDTAILLPTSMPLVHARQWKAQVPFLARHFRVIVVDMRGNGRSDRPTRTRPLRHRAGRRGPGRGPGRHRHRPGRRHRAVGGRAAGAGARRGAPGPGGRSHRDRAHRHVPRHRVRHVRERYDGMERFNRHHITADYAGSPSGSSPRATPIRTPRSRREDALGWSTDTDAGAVIDALTRVRPAGNAGRPRERCGNVSCPVLVVHGDEDPSSPYALGAAVAEWTGGTLVSLAGAGHVPRCGSRSASTC